MLMSFTDYYPFFKSKYSEEMKKVQSFEILILRLSVLIQHQQLRHYSELVNYQGNLFYIILEK